MYRDLSCLPLEVARHASEVLCAGSMKSTPIFWGRFHWLGAVAPSSDFLLRSGPFVHSPVQSFSFFILSV